MKAQYGPPVKRKIPFYVNADESLGESGFGGRRLLSNGKGVRRAGGAAGECSSTGKVERAKRDLQGNTERCTDSGLITRDEQGGTSQNGTWQKWNKRGRRRTERRENGTEWNAARKPK
jgi:hypothetical protein